MLENFQEIQTKLDLTNVMKSILEVQVSLCSYLTMCVDAPHWDGGKSRLPFW